MRSESSATRRCCHAEKPTAWFAPTPELEPTAHRLADRRYFVRRWDRDRQDVVYRVTRSAVQAQELHNVMAASTSKHWCGPGKVRRELTRRSTYARFNLAPAGARPA
jgi:hypothetical protein